MEPLEPDLEPADDLVKGRRPSLGAVVAIAVVVILIAVMVALHLAGGAPTHR